jgi:hypothetical protein
LRAKIPNFDRLVAQLTVSIARSQVDRGGERVYCDLKRGGGDLEETARGGERGREEGVEAAEAEVRFDQSAVKTQPASDAIIHI